MGLWVDSEKVPPRWREAKGTGASVSSLAGSRPEGLCIAFINNMPDAALEDTEMQFFELLDRAAGNLPVLVKLFSLPQVPRTERGKKHLSEFYYSIEELLNGHFDALIMTGTEPIERDLRREPYWPFLATVLEWAESNTISTVLSCLAAHAAVLHSDGIERNPLPDKRFGVFEFPVRHHALTQGLGNAVTNPHSRWNEVIEEDLVAHGYRVLTKSAEAGVDLFTKNKGRSLFVHFQGHPEYGASTLFKEYRRDVRRFLRGERETYPNLPRGYFGSSASAALVKFQEIGLKDRCEELMAMFPESAAAQDLHNGWSNSAARIYGNWLQYVCRKKAEHASLPVITRKYQHHSTATPNIGY